MTESIIDFIGNFATVHFPRKETLKVFLADRESAREEETFRVFVYGRESVIRKPLRRLVFTL